MMRIEAPYKVVKVAGDSGDGVQVVGSQLAYSSALLGNDVHTFPDYPAEIRAPAGSLAGVSGFQLQFAAQAIYTHGDALDVLVAFNPAALLVNLKAVRPQGMIILDRDTWHERAWQKAGLSKEESPDLQDYRLLEVPMTSLTLEAIAEYGLSHSKAKRCKNFFALGILYWIFERSLQQTQEWLAVKFGSTPICYANQAALKAGYHYAQTLNLATALYRVQPADLQKGRYRHITGTQAMSAACTVLAARWSAGVFFASYPITPASDLLHELINTPDSNITCFQAEDEIAAACAALGAAYGGSLGITATSGPGFDLKMETIGLAVMAELPLIILDIQRAGPSTGMPTKVEQSDLYAAKYGRHGDCPVPILAPQSPHDCFDSVLQAAQIALRYMTPVIVLSDAYLANGAEPWCLPKEIPDLPDCRISGSVSPYQRDPTTFARPWILPGEVGREHTIGGLEKSISGRISYDPENHQYMTDMRAQKVAQITLSENMFYFYGRLPTRLCVVCWGSPFGAAFSAVTNLQQQGLQVSLLVIRLIVPLPIEVGSILKNAEQTLVLELNQGQLAHILAAEYGCVPQRFNKVAGQPFTVVEIEQRLKQILS